MSYRPSPKYASKSPGLGSAWSACDRCGFQWNQRNLQWQYNFQGGSTPQNLRFLHCPLCIDPLGYQQKLIVVPADPSPLFNTRPEPYVVDETNWMTTQSGDIIDTQSGLNFVTSIPDPNQNADTAILSVVMRYPSGSVASAYLDIFNGSPASGGVSVLSAITGSSVRSNVGPALSITAQNVAENTDVLTVSSSAVSITNAGFAALYSAASGGSLLAYGPMSVSAPSIVKGAVVQFNALGLSVNLAP